MQDIQDINEHQHITMVTLLNALSTRQNPPKPNLQRYLNDSTGENTYEVRKRGKNKNGGNQLIALKINQLTVNDDVMELLQSIIDENWFPTAPGETSIPEISISAFKISKEYLELKLAQLNSLITEESADDQDNYQRVLYATLAIKFYLDKKHLQIPLPSKKVTLEEAKRDFFALKDQTRTQDKKHLGKKAANHFMEGERLKCGLVGLKPLNVAYISSTLIGRISNHMIQHQELSSKLFNTLYSDCVPSQFRPYEVQKLVKELQDEHKDISIENFFNPCGGWGDRLVGALATPSIKRYIETDPNKPLKLIKELICHHFNTDDPEKKIHLYDQPVEDLSPEQCAPDGVKNDFVLYSPPYFKMEKYPDQGGTQSHTRYPKFAQWFTSFLMKSVDISHQALLPNRFFAINIAIISDGNNKIDLPSQFMNEMINRFNRHFTWLKAVDYAIRTRRTSGYSASKIYIYKTKELIMSPTTGPQQLWVQNPMTSSLFRSSHKRKLGICSNESVETHVSDLFDASKRSCTKLTPPTSPYSASSCSISRFFRPTHAVAISTPMLISDVTTGNSMWSTAVDTPENNESTSASEQLIIKESSPAVDLSFFPSNWIEKMDISDNDASMDVVTELFELDTNIYALAVKMFSADGS